MSRPDLKKLAEAALKDPDFLPVLGDAVLEDGIQDEVVSLDELMREGRPWRPDNSRSWSTDRMSEAAAKPTIDLAKRVIRVVSTGK